MTYSLDDIPELAGEIAEALRPVVDRAVEKRVGEELGRERKRQSRDEAIMAACRAVAEATDRLEQVRYTAEERPARIAVEKAARQLAKVMRGRT